MYKQLKLTARKKLSGGNLSFCAGAVMICFLVFLTGSFSASAAANILNMLPLPVDYKWIVSAIWLLICTSVTFALSPILLGCFRLFFLAVMGEQPKLSELFHYMNKSLYKKAVFFCFSMAIGFLVIFAASFLLLAIVSILFQVLSLGSVVHPIVGLIILSLLAVIGVFSFIAISSQLMYAPVSFVRFPDSPVLFHFQRSRNICRNRFPEIFIFYISFIPWFFLSYLVIPLLWTIPYYFVAMIVFCLGLEKQYEQRSAAPHTIHVRQPKVSSERKASETSSSLPPDAQISCQTIRDQEISKAPEETMPPQNS